MNDEPDLVTNGFTRLPPLKETVPQIAWGKNFMEWPPARQLTYAKDLASSMNHAAKLMQDERNAANQVAMRCTAQVKQLQHEAQANHDLLQRQLTRWNTEKQELLAEIATLERAAGKSRAHMLTLPPIGEEPDGRHD